MAKRIIFSVILIIICGGSFFIGVYSSGGLNKKPSQEQEILPEEEKTAVDVKQKKPKTAFICPGLEAEKGKQK